MNALCVKIECKSDEVYVAGSLSVAEQCTFNTICLRWKTKSVLAFNKSDLYEPLPFALVQQLLQHTHLKTSDIFSMLCYPQRVYSRAYDRCAGEEIHLSSLVPRYSCKSTRSGPHRYLGARPRLSREG